MCILNLGCFSHTIFICRTCATLCLCVRFCMFMCISSHFVPRDLAKDSPRNDKVNITDNKEYPSTMTTQEGTQRRIQLRARKRTVVQSAVHIDAGRCRCSQTDSGCNYVQEYGSPFCVYCRPCANSSLQCVCPCQACDSSDSDSADADDDGDVEVSNEVPSCRVGFIQNKRARVEAQRDSLASSRRAIARSSI